MQSVPYEQEEEEEMEEEEEEKEEEEEEKEVEAFEAQNIPLRQIAQFNFLSQKVGPIR